MTATIALWVVWVVLGVSVALAVGLAIAWGSFKEKRATGQWGNIRPLYDLRFLMSKGEPVIQFVECNHNGEWCHPMGDNKVKYYVNDGVFGWFGGKVEAMPNNDYWEVGGLIFRGREEFEKFMKVKLDVMRSELERYRDLAQEREHYAEQTRHDPDKLVEKKIEQVGDLAKHAANMAPRPAKPGAKK